ncbi:MAG TPA: HDOD domain-containing protein, partial [Leptospiraceae bacterium]|nr:HDOD domain-containing protein [Leptospiraceae bacterium]
MLLDINDIVSKLIKGQPVSVRFKYTNDKILQEFHVLFIHILAYFDQLFLLEVSFTVLKEILYNASKANAKRLYFIRESLDISNPDDYQKGMAVFAEEVTMKWNEQQDFLDKSEFYIQFEAKIKDNTLYIKAENNAPVLPEEQQRIHKRIEAAKKYNDLSDAFMDMSDSTESAGLGLILTQILLKNSGIGRENFNIEFQSDKTIAHFTIPGKVIPIVTNSKFNEQILNEIDGLPPLPQSVSKIINLCNKPDTDINILTAEIEKDAVLSADLLKLSNSSLFITRNKANTVLSAVKVVGLKNIKNMLYVSGVRKIMGNRYDKVQKIWDHCAKCSFFAKVIAVDNSKHKISDLAATGGLLHDIGKLIILSLDKKVVEKMTNLQIQEKDSSVLIEEFTFGISHADIGARLLKKWSFPDDLVHIVEFHHRPFLAPAEHRDLLEIVYLANMMLDALDGRANFFT